MASPDHALGRQLNEFALRYNVPGLRHSEDRRRFLDCLVESASDLQAIASGQLHPKSRRGPGSPFNPFSEIKRLASEYWEEAVWLAFLATHLGWDRPDSCGVVYRAFTNRPVWTWRRIEEDEGESFARWVGARWLELRSLAPFGNHRKYLSHNPAVPVSTAWVVRSYAKWANSGLVRLAGSGARRRGFHDHYEGLSGVRGLGRTGRYDFLRLLGLMELAQLQPQSCYLLGATGPLRGAALMFTGHVASSGDVHQLERRTLGLAVHLHLDSQVIEDAICNWQKASHE